MTKGQPLWEVLFEEDGTPRWLEDIRPSEGLNIRKGRHRREDWVTSIEGARSVAYRAGSQKRLLLDAYRDAYPNALTDEEAAQAAGIPLTSEYSKRCGELRQDGHIVVSRDFAGNPITKAGSTGIRRIVCEWQEIPAPEPHGGRIQGRARNPREAVMLTEKQADILIDGYPNLVTHVANKIAADSLALEEQAKKAIDAVAEWLTTYRPAEFGDEFCTPLDVTAFILRRGEPRE